MTLWLNNPYKKQKREETDMAWTEPKGDVIDIKTKNPGTQLVGTYTGHKTVKTQLGENTIWQFQDPEGVPFGVWGFTNFNFQMERVGVGMNCRLTYKGKSAMKNKYGKFPHQVKVEVETDDSESVTAPDMPPDAE